MEEEIETPSSEYVASFNDGYLLATHLPDLSIQLTKSLTASEKSQGLADGIRQGFDDRTRSLEPAWSKESFFKGGDRLQGNTKDKDSKDVIKD